MSGLAGSAVVLSLLLTPMLEEIHQPLPNSFITVPILLENNRVFAEVLTAEEIPRLFLIDNGWRGTSVARGVFKTLPMQQTYTIRTSVLGQKGVEEQYALLPYLNMGGFTVSSPVVRLSEQMNQLSKTLGRRVHGVFGSGLMIWNLVTFDIQKREVRFLPAEQWARRYVRNEAGTIVLPFGRHNLSPANIQLFTIPVVINGKRVEAIVDMGFDGGVLTTRNPSTFLRRQRPSGSAFPVMIMSYKGMAKSTFDNEIAIGPHTLDQVHMVYMKGRNVPEMVVIGMRVLSRFRFTFDYDARTFYLAPGS